MKHFLYLVNNPRLPRRDGHHAAPANLERPLFVIVFGGILSITIVNFRIDVEHLIDAKLPERSFVQSRQHTVEVLTSVTILV